MMEVAAASYRYYRNQKTSRSQTHICGSHDQREKISIWRTDMKYDFTTMPDRAGRDALAVDAIGANVDWAIAPTAPKEGFS